MGVGNREASTTALGIGFGINAFIATASVKNRAESLARSTLETIPPPIKRARIRVGAAVSLLGGCRDVNRRKVSRR